MRGVIIASLFAAAAHGSRVAPRVAPRASSAVGASRRAFAEGISLLAAAQVLAAAPRVARASGATTTASGLTYTVVKSGKGTVTPIVGELALLRWQASCNGVVFDDLFKKDDFYYHRVGSGNLVAGVEEALYLMHAGDVFELEIPGSLGFGAKGKKASPGQPSIPPNATLKYKLELLALPGRDEELLEVTGGGDEPAPAM